ncbi:MAG: M23 family metallopeptidase [Candidatus Aminicenantes bacterium]|nr:M23 family metallopeptidase [Candidatus Aminicenantes bacterium]
MSKKFLSLIIVPHCAQRFKTITVSQKTLKLLGVIGAFAAIAMVGFLVDYFAMNVTRAKYKALLSETSQQKKQLSEYEQSIRKLRETVKNFENYARKLNVMAGLRSPEVMEELGIGSGDTTDIESSEPGGGPSIPPAGQAVSLQEAQALALKAEDVGKNLDVLASFFEAQTIKLASTPTIWPTIGWVSSPFAYRDDPFTGKRQFHYGIDIATNFGNPIVATANGIVISLGNDKMGGKNIVISHGNGITTHYLHLSKFLVKSGQKIKRGDVIGLVGNTGKARGPHLHYEVRVNNRPVNPYNYILEEE